MTVAILHHQPITLRKPPFNRPSPADAAWVAAKRDAAKATDRNFVAIAGDEQSENDGPKGTGHLERHQQQ